MFSYLKRLRHTCRRGMEYTDKNWLKQIEGIDSPPIAERTIYYKYPTIAKPNTLYYLRWLVYFYRLTPSQIFALIAIWLRSKMIVKDPASKSIKQGEGKPYPQINKS